ncbi:aspartyl-tRNA(Asn)/glutamyl-tRNA (Gln) amidotransferase subunit B [Capronia coronata CBS 617.96]|uniref:Glutamyl-tRNA(Gln) amidotransferase subunit B, mitochondrial n=1 Tax=Capronia coronata CBS 617.96 TaxID=1182541 RepID=W9YS73_9EURO|nr:aspartyl-tRNA(Asn)/glutamyl-tRNA (Gln) amidotransferase subunit B [Capronia coronata CBS 617.96]EXJ95757.1 aspartyl-tRNA(Asn)/glutamyl-tRNA (Gln) amidotransferase subunit B [Capronia coronata CBS 617.96]
MQQRWMSRTLHCFRHGRLVQLNRYNTSNFSSPRRLLNVHLRSFHCSEPRWQDDSAPLRKELKDAAKAARKAAAAVPPESPDILPDWELTVGIEIHAQLNAARKLFSTADTYPASEPNSHISAFDIALPGSLPVFQPAVVLPALRAAIALQCTILTKSTFDRKHYFYHDQPAGYQITQYYTPFAVQGHVVLTSEDGLEDGREVVVNIKQVQLEQDTARSQEEDSSTTLIDFNRCGQALIEIISLPELHSPREAAAYVRKVQSMLYAVDAVTTGMEQGGLRADVNVSVRRRDVLDGGFSYAGISGLGQRTEIKNLSTFKGIEDAIKAERDRQISLIESGGVVEGETRGWSITKPHETRRLRGKEGEIDYRYMPDADIPPLYIGTDLIGYVRRTLPPLPTDLTKMLVDDYGLSPTDARTLVLLDDGERLIYFQRVVAELASLAAHSVPQAELGKTAANWVLHELGSLFSSDERPWSSKVVPFDAMAEIVHRLREKQITGASAKLILKLVFNGDRRPVSQIVRQEELAFSEMSADEYDTIAREIVEKFPQHVKDIVEKGKTGKLQFLMGQMMRHPRRGDMRAPDVEKALRQVIFQGKP